MLKKKQQTTQKKYTPSRYTRLSNIYNQTEFQDIQKLLEYLASTCVYSIKYPILKLLRAVCRSLLINELQSIFFAYVIQTNGWNLQDSIIRKYKQGVKDIVFYATTDQDYKALSLYLLLCGYTSKFYLNDCTDLYSAELQKICSDFKSIFSQWVKQQAHTTLKINPRSLNKVYKRIYLQSKSKGQLQNYNSLVDNILLICPCYNPEREKETINNVKEEKTQQKVVRSTPMNISMTVANLPILSSSGFLQQIGIMPINSSLILSQSLHKKNASFGLGNSEYGINNFTLLDDHNDINQFHIGFKQCESDNQQHEFVVQRVQLGTKQQSKGQTNVSNTSSYFC